MWWKTENKNNLRVIKTARDKNSINEAASNGFWPLIKVLKPNPQIQSKICILQHKETGEIHVKGDFRRWTDDDYESPYVEVTSWIYYYPHQFPNPYAAYLIPKDIIQGERVYIEDLIEDFIGASWNQGDKYRLPSYEAIWNGKDLVIQYDPDVNKRDFVG